jgi:hypothetical protein
MISYCLYGVGTLLPCLEAHLSTFVGLLTIFLNDQAKVSFFIRQNIV